jgi:hypothetical protein
MPHKRLHFFKLREKPDVALADLCVLFVEFMGKGPALGIPNVLKLRVARLVRL